MLTSTRCSFVQNQMAAYIARELPAETRRYVAAHIDQCDACRMAYTHERAAADEYNRDVPMLGRAQAGQLAMIWQQIQLDVSAPPPSTPSIAGLRLGMVLVMGISALLLLAVAFHSPMPPRVLVRQPAPMLIRSEVTPQVDARRTQAQASHVVVYVLITQPSRSRGAVGVTPEPVFIHLPR